MERRSMEKTKHKASASTDKINTSTIDDLDKRPRLQVVPDAGSGSSREAKGSWRETWETYKGMTMVLGAESFGSGMAVATKLLEMGGADGMPGMQAPQILFVRFLITWVSSSIYMYFAKTPDFPLGPKGTRLLLALRGILGCIGVWAFYYSIMYLPIAESIIIGFLAPLATGLTSSLVTHQKVSIKQIFATVSAFVGIIIIAHPWSNFVAPHESSKATTGPGSPTGNQHQRYLAIGSGLIAVAASTGSYICIRAVGDRASALVQVNYYAFETTVITGVLLAFPIIPNLNFRLPDGVREWSLLFYLGVCGFLLQVLLTAGLARDKTSRATNMMYSQIFFALMFDWAIWDIVPSWWSAVGGCVVLAAVIYGALQKDEGEKKTVADEEYAMVPPAEFVLGEDDADEDEVASDEGYDSGEDKELEANVLSHA